MKVLVLTKSIEDLKWHAEGPLNVLAETPTCYQVAVPKKKKSFFGKTTEVNHNFWAFKDATGQRCEVVKGWPKV